MAVPKKRKSKMKTRQGRAHHALTAATPGTCPNCNEPVMPHRVCGACGHYKGRQILETEE